MFLQICDGGTVYRKACGLGVVNRLVEPRELLDPGVLYREVRELMSIVVRTVPLLNDLQSRGILAYRLNSAACLCAIP